MNHKKAYEITFVGQDYQPIEKAANSIQIKCNEDDFLIDTIKKNSETILDCFLKEIAPNGRLSEPSIIFNSSQRNNKHELYNPNFGSENSKGYFCGLVGIIKKRILVDLCQDEK